MSSRTRTMMRALAVMLGLGLSAAACGSQGGDLEVTNIDPRAGATAGEQPVRILGNNFRQDIGYTVYFGAKRAERATIADPHTLVVSTPQMENSGPVDVIVAADDGPAFRIVQGFRFEEMGGNVMEQVGGSSGGRSNERF